MFLPNKPEELMKKVQISKEELGEKGGSVIKIPEVSKSGMDCKIFYNFYNFLDIN